MFKRVRLLIVTVLTLVSVMAPAMSVAAAEVSEKEIEVTQDGKKHTVCTFGNCITMIYPDGMMEIITNDPSGRIDVMIDGQVTKGVGHMVIPSANKTNLVLQEGSFIVSGVTEEHAQTIKKLATDGLAADVPIASLTVIEEQATLQGVEAFAIGTSGVLEKADGTKAPANTLPQTEIKTTAEAYQEFAQEMEETIRREAAEEAARNGIAGQCDHSFVEYDGVLTINDYMGYKACAKGGITRCTKCGMYVIDKPEERIVPHVPGTKCSICGWESTVVSIDPTTCNHQDALYTDKAGIDFGRNHEYCMSGGPIYQCTLCHRFDTTAATIRTDHTVGMYCEICESTRKVPTPESPDME